MVQDVFIRLLRYRSKCFDDREHLKAWLIRVTINRCRDYRRFALHRNETTLVELPEQQEVQSSQLYEEIASLLREDRVIMYLHYYEGYSIKEIGKILGKSPNTVGSRLTRAKSKLRAMLQEA